MTIQFANNATARIIAIDANFVRIGSNEQAPFMFLPGLVPMVAVFGVATLETADRSQVEIVKLTHRIDELDGISIGIERGYEGAQIPVINDFLGGKIEIRMTAKSMNKFAKITDTFLIDGNGDILTDGANVLTT